MSQSFGLLLNRGLKGKVKEDRMIIQAVQITEQTSAHRYVSGTDDS